MSILLCFAHRGEAHYFLEHGNWQAYSNPRIKLYQNNQQEYLLLTGEGIEETIASLSIAITLLS